MMRARVRCSVGLLLLACWFSGAQAESLAGRSDLAYDRQATADCPKTDRYGRWVCVVRVDGRDVGLEQINLGLAWWYRQYARDQKPEDRVSYEQAEREAREKQSGLWRDDSPMPPWAWRRQPHALKDSGF